MDEDQCVCPLKSAAARQQKYYLYLEPPIPLLTRHNLWLLNTVLAQMRSYPKRIIRQYRSYAFLNDLRTKVCISNPCNSFFFIAM
jgi:hypothetical protein